MFSRRHPFLFSMLVFTAIVSGSMVMISLLFAIGSSDTELVAGDKVAVIEIEGVITESKDAIRQMKTYREDDHVKAIVLRINTPGGGVGPSQEIYQEVRKTVKKKNVIASMGAVAASGGYYIASAASGIVANPGTITGSIGVIMGYTNFQEIFQKIGLVPIVIKSGEYKDMGSPVRKMTDEEKRLLQGFVDKIHNQFVRDAALGRNIELEKMKALADGRIYSGEEAQQLGLIDRLGNLEDAIAWAGKLGGIEGKVSTVYPKEKPLSLLRHLTEASLKEILSDIVNPQMRAEYRYQP
jgi:protease-4